MNKHQLNFVKVQIFLLFFFFKNFKFENVFLKISKKNFQVSVCWLMHYNPIGLSECHSHVFLWSAVHADVYLTHWLLSVCEPHEWPMDAWCQWQSMKRSTWWPMIWPRDHLKNAYGHLHIRVPKFLPLNNMHIFQYMNEIFSWNLKRYLWNSTQDVLAIHWKIWFFHSSQNLKALIFKNP